MGKDYVPLMEAVGLDAARMVTIALTLLSLQMVPLNRINVARTTIISNVDIELAGMGTAIVWSNRPKAHLNCTSVPLTTVISNAGTRFANKMAGVQMCHKIQTILKRISARRRMTKFSVVIEFV